MQGATFPCEPFLDLWDSCTLCRLRDSQTGWLHQILLKDQIGVEKVSIIFSSKGFESGSSYAGSSPIKPRFGFLAFLTTACQQMISKHHTMTSHRELE